MTKTQKRTHCKRLLSAAMALAAVALMASSGTAALAADASPRAQMDAGTDGNPVDAGTSELDAGLPELQGTLHGEVLRGKNVPQ